MFKSDVGEYRYDDPAHPHAATLVHDIGEFSYDQLGNQEWRPGVDKIAYTAFDLPARFEKSNGDIISFDYDGEQKRIRKTTPTHQTVYFDDLYEAVEDLSTHEVTRRLYIAAGSATVVLTLDHGGDSESYVFTDALGSTDVVTDNAGHIVEPRSYDAFGARRNPEWGAPPAGSDSSAVTPAGYTGHESDDELGLVNMKGRIYDPAIGRFLQTDPIVAEPHFGQSWNPYSYVLNSPLNFVDPSGFQAADPMTGTLSQNGQVYATFPGEDYKYDGPGAAGFRMSRSLFDRLGREWTPKDSGRDDDLKQYETQAPGRIPAEARERIAKDPNWHYKYPGRPEDLQPRRWDNTPHDITLKFLTEDCPTCGAVAQTLHAVGSVAMLKQDLRSLASVRFVGHIGAAGTPAERRAPFNPTGARLNCVEAVCAFINSVKSHRLVEGRPDYAFNGGSIERANSIIRGATGVRVGQEQSHTLRAAGDRTTFFIVYPRPGAGGVAHHVMIGINNKGTWSLYDPQSGQKSFDRASFGPFSAYPVLLPKRQ